MTEFFLRIMINHENRIIPYENHANYENHRIPNENNDNHENPRISFENQQFFGEHRIISENYKKMKILEFYTINNKIIIFHERIT